MITVGLTGGFGSGKSAVAEMLAAKGATVMYADQVGHEVYRRGTDEYLQIVAAFGPEVIGEDGEIDRRRLGQTVFADSQARQRLIQNRGFTSEQAQARLEAQLGNQERRRHADVIIDNGGSLEETRRQVDRLWTKLKERAAVVAPKGGTGARG